MKQASASHPKIAEGSSAADFSEGIAHAKRELIDAFYRASPARAVEKHPWLSVTATASAALAATVIAHAPLSRKVISAGLMQTLRSALPMIQALAMQKMKHAAPPTASQPGSYTGVG